MGSLRWQEQKSPKAIKTRVMRSLFSKKLRDKIYDSVNKIQGTCASEFTGNQTHRQKYKILHTDVLFKRFFWEVLAADAPLDGDEAKQVEVQC